MNKVYIIRPTSMPDKRHAQSLLNARNLSCHGIAVWSS